MLKEQRKRSFLSIISFQASMRKYTSAVAYVMVTYPSIVILVTLSITSYLSYLGITHEKEFQIDTGFDSFKSTSGEATREQEFFINTLQQDSSSRDLQFVTRVLNGDDDDSSVTDKTLVDVAVFFTVPSGQNILVPSLLNRIRRIDHKIRSLNSFKALCVSETSNNKTSCTPPVSPLPYLFFSQSEKTMGLPIFDGKSQDISHQKIKQGLDFLLSQDAAYAFFDQNFNLSSRISSAMVIKYAFKCPLEGFSSCDDRRDSQKTTVGEFCQDILQPLLNDASDDESLDAFYGSNSLSQVIIKTILKRDLRYAIGTFTFLLIFMALHINSLVLAVAGMLHIIMAFPLTYYIYHVVLGIHKVNLMNFLSVFVILGIGADDIFVLVDCWKLSKTTTVKHKLQDRMIYVLEKAVTSTFITSFTTACAFGSSVVSSIPPIQHFGTFMALLVTWNYVLCVTYYPAVLVLYSKWANIRFKKRNSTTTGVELPSSFEETTCRRRPSSPLFFPIKDKATAIIAEDDPMMSDDVTVTSPINKFVEPKPETRLTKPKPLKEALATFFGKTLVLKFIVKFRAYILLTYVIMIAVAAFYASQIAPALGKPSFLPSSHPLQKALYTWKHVMFNTQRKFDNEDTSSSVAVNDGTLSVQSLYSRTLQSSQYFQVYLPPSYNVRPDSYFPVVYLLHDFGGNESTYGDPLSSLLNQVYKSSLIPESIIVKPSGNTKNILGGSMFINSATHGNVQDYIINELVPYVDSQYRIIGNQKAIIGVGGMGGYGALRMHFNDKSPFVATAVHSPISTFNFSSKFKSIFTNETKNSGNGATPSPTNGKASYLLFTMASVFNLPIPFSDNIQSMWNDIGNIESYVDFIEGRNYIRSLYIDVGVSEDEKSFGPFDFPFQANHLVSDVLGNNTNYTFSTYTGSHTNRLATQLIKSLSFTSRAFESRENVATGCTVECEKSVGGSCVPVGECLSIRYSTCSSLNDCNDCIISHECQCTNGYYGESCNHKDAESSSELPYWALVKVDLIYYDFQQSFNNPIVQESLLNVCDSLTSDEAMVHSVSSCVIKYFSKWVVSEKNETFPVKSGDASLLLQEYVQLNSYYANDVRFGTDEDLRWIKLTIRSRVDEGGNASYLKSQYEDWKSYTSRNLNVVPSTKVMQVSDSWVRFELETSAARDTTLAILISLIIAGVSIMIFTQSVTLALCCTILIASIMCIMLAFFVLAGWTLGSIEAISLSVIVGLAVDFSLHIVHACENNSTSSHSRIEKVQSALSTVGVSIVGGAFSTAGASAFLLFCTIQVLLLFGMVILANTLTSLVLSMIVLPAVLTLVGPETKTKEFMEDDGTEAHDDDGKENNVISSI